MANENDTKPVVRYDIPLALNSLMLLPHRAVLDKPNTPGARAIGAAEVAMKSLHDSLAEMVDTKKYVVANARPTGEQIMIPKSATPYQVLGVEENLREAMGRSFERSAQILDRQRKVVETSITEIEAAISGKLQDPTADKPSTVSVAAEVRAHCKSLKAGERVGFVQKAVADGDLPVIAAILNATPSVSGLTREQQAALRIHAAEYFAGTKDDFAALQATRSVLGKLESASGSFITKYADLLPPNLKAGQQAAGKAIAALASGKAKENA